MTDEDFAAYVAARFPPRVEPVVDPLADLTRERDAAVAALAEREAELGRALAALAQMREERDGAESYRAEAVRTLVSERSKWAADEMALRQERDEARAAALASAAPCRPAPCAEGLPAPTGYVHEPGTRLGNDAVNAETRL